MKHSQENDITEASITLGEFQKKTKQLETILQVLPTIKGKINILFLDYTYSAFIGIRDS